MFFDEDKYFLSSLSPINLINLYTSKYRSNIILTLQRHNFIIYSIVNFNVVSLILFIIITALHYFFTFSIGSFEIKVIEISVHFGDSTPSPPELTQKKRCLYSRLVRERQYS